MNMNKEGDFTRNFLRSKEAFLMAVVLFVAAVGPLIIILVTRPVVVHYWGSAPDGTYHVLANTWNAPNDTSVYFPICEHSGSELHGWWIKLSIVNMTDNTWYYVRLKDNVIVEAWQQ